ncbi:hypothetical protein I862_01345 [endosymbiont of Acanthamoeba sp. UWC8]|uniref:hypothetical protein n=1 Tax=endosymbiont of Acanthamoeba sp. UWC8 TaxID=86106 RepID=UPI0004D1ACBC|nr:hypothetical protein [endosymbiont of Acanthamoeba sp. UWC8]AIF80832.1 hypothetical protein I862_01345 [endosymbiont of Acanthamoeba sp. UWC8]
MQERGNANENGYSHVPIRPRHTEVTSESQPERKKRRIEEPKQNISFVPNQGNASSDSFLSESLKDLGSISSSKASLGSFFIEKIRREQKLAIENEANARRNEEELLKRIANLKQNKKGLQKEIGNWRNQNGSLWREKTSLNDENEVLRAKVGSLTEDNKNLFKCLEYLKKREEGLRSEVLALQKEYTVLDEKLSKVQNERAVLEEKFAKLKDNNERSISIAGRWEEFCLLKQAELEEKQNELEEIKEENALLKQQIIRPTEYTETSTALSSQPHSNQFYFEPNPENSKFAPEQFTLEALEQFITLPPEGYTLTTHSESSTQPIERAPGYWRERVEYGAGSPSFRG